jgi:hypothetical protein
MMRSLSLAVVILALVASALPGIAQPTPAPKPVPYTWGTSAPGAPAPPPVPNAKLATFTGQLLDVVNGYAYFTTGDAFKIQSAFRVVDYFSGAATTVPPSTKMYAKATLDEKTGEIIELAITKKPLPTSKSYADVRQYVVVKSTAVPAPEIRTTGRAPTGRSVTVLFTVEVPLSTPISDSVYISTDASGWVPNAMRMDRIDERHYRLAHNFASGTELYYKYTRGDWNKVERGPDGLEPPAHHLFVPEADAFAQRWTISFWSDQNPSQPQVGPNSIPTPFNVNPFPCLPTRANPRPLCTPSPR